MLRVLCTCYRSEDVDIRCTVWFFLLFFSRWWLRPRWFFREIRQKVLSSVVSVNSARAVGCVCAYVFIYLQLLECFRSDSSPRWLSSFSDSGGRYLVRAHGDPGFLFFIAREKLCLSSCAHNVLKLWIRSLYFFSVLFFFFLLVLCSKTNFVMRGFRHSPTQLQCSRVPIFLEVSGLLSFCKFSTLNLLSHNIYTYVCVL